MNDHTTARLVLRSPSGRWITGALVVLCAYLLLDAAVRGSWAVVLLGLPWLALIVTLCWAVVLRPCVIVEAAGLTVVNVFRTHRVPWSSIDELTVRYQLIVRLTDGTKVTAWGAPTIEKLRSVRPDPQAKRAKPLFVNVVDVIERERAELDADAPQHPRSVTPAWAPLALIVGLVAVGILVSRLPV